MKQGWRVLAPVGVGFAFLIPLFAVLGISPWRAFASLVQGSMGSGEAWTNTLLKFSPLLLTGMGVLISFRSGFLNIGAEGQFLAGALGAAAWSHFGGFASNLGWPGVLAAGAAGGAIWCLIAVWLRLRFGVQDVIGTLMLNFIAIYLVSYAVHGPLQEAAGSYPQSDVLSEVLLLDRLGGGRIHMGLLMAILAAWIAGFWISRTASGFLARAAGSGPRAALAAGISSTRVLPLSASIAGGLCGLAGAIEVAGVSGRVYEGFSAGYGYTAIAVALLARLHPWGLFASALFFSVLTAGASWTQRTLGIPSVALFVVQGVVIGTVAVMTAKKR